MSKAQTPTTLSKEDYDVKTRRLDYLGEEVRTLQQENQRLRQALSELEQEKATLAHSFLTASLRIRMLLQPQQDNANPT